MYISPSSEHELWTCGTSLAALPTLHVLRRRKDMIPINAQTKSIIRLVIIHHLGKVYYRLRYVLRSVLERHRDKNMVMGT